MGNNPVTFRDPTGGWDEGDPPPYGETYDWDGKTFTWDEEHGQYRREEYNRVESLYFVEKNRAEVNHMYYTSDNGPSMDALPNPPSMGSGPITELTELVPPEEKRARMEANKMQVMEAMNDAAQATVAFITADGMTPDPTDAAWMKWAGYSVAGGVAAGYIYYYQSVWGDPKNWVPTVLPKTDPFLRSKSNYDYKPDPLNEIPNGNWGPWAGGIFGVGYGYYRLKQEFNDVNVNPPNPTVTPQDNTRVEPIYRPYHGQ